MLVPSVPRFRRQRGGAKRKPPAAAPVALALVSVEIQSIDGADAFLRLVFNTTAQDPLSDVTAATAAKWTARYDGITYEVGAVE